MFDALRKKLDADLLKKQIEKLDLQISIADDAKHYLFMEDIERFKKAIELLAALK